MPEGVKSHLEEIAEIENAHFSGDYELIRPDDPDNILDRPKIK